MRSLLLISLLALATGCGQKGPLTLKPAHAKTPVAASASAPSADAPAATPAAASGQAPAADAGKKDPAADQPKAPRG